jgi:tetratricopeptide (TPR) repeat protein
MDVNTVLLVRNPATTYAQVMEFAAYWLEEAKSADRWFPHFPEVAHHILEWHNMLIRNMTDSTQKQNLLHQSLDWAKECVDRSPKEAAFRHLYAGILWEQASHERGSHQLECYEKALEQLRTATKLYPAKPDLWEAYGSRLMSYGAGLRRAGRREQGEELWDRGIEARKHGHDLQRQLNEIASARAGRGEQQ